jgi:predicted lipoprotein with Yx(FWY)xxD motif
VKGLFALAVATAALFAGGCGEGDDNAAQTGGSATATGSGETAAGAPDVTAAQTTLVANRSRARRARRRGTVVKVIRSPFGRVLADRRGQAVYLFAKERGRRSRCYGACARAWPPLLTRGRPRARSGARARLLGITRRRNGRFQVTYRGHPLYYYEADKPGLILCQNVVEFGGRWLVVKPSGRPVA